MKESQVAVVTGGTGGIGSAICQNLAQNGYHVVACYYKGGNHAVAKQWQKEQLARGVTVDIAYADIARYEDCEKLAHLVLEKYGAVNVLVNNAGITKDTSFKKMQKSQWHEVIDANLNSLFNVTRNFINSMLDNGDGRIINISSINGRKGQFGQCNYSASKSAIFGFTKSLAQEVAKKGVTVNAVSPGYIKTEMLAHLKQEVLDAIIAQIPVGRLGSVEEIARLVTFLADKESGYITGSNFDINGGQYM
jgi:acetoacetyl-CoA reductase